MKLKAVKKMIFSELYGVYFKTTEKILKAAIAHPASKDEINKIIRENAFEESILNIGEKINDGKWELIKSDRTTLIEHVNPMPLTTLEKSWLLVIYSDPRIRLFTDERPEYPGIEPLFDADDVLIFDKCSDGDDYTDEGYIARFRLILDAIKNGYPLSIDTSTGAGGVIHVNILPHHLEYSEKDDKFRLIGSGEKYESTINLGRIISCSRYDGEIEIKTGQEDGKHNRTVVFEVTDQRNALERVLMHFAHFEKEAERLSEDRYRVSLVYDENDEAEILIRILSFGQMVKVTSPDYFIDLIRKRLYRQKTL